MGVRVSFLEREQPKQARKPSALAPADAIVEQGGRSVVFVVEGEAGEETVARNEVTLGRTLGDDREVLAGLSGGERIVLNPPEKLVDGARVRVTASAAEDDAESAE
jgi:hypothetical protein